MARAEDYWYNGYIGQGEMVWTVGDFCTKLRLPAELGGAGELGDDALVHFLAAPGGWAGPVGGGGNKLPTEETKSGDLFPRRH